MSSRNKSSSPINIKALSELVNKFKDEEISGATKKYNEAQTKQDYIEPFLRTIGWNVENRSGNNSYVKLEKNINGKRADYELGIDGIPKLYIEAKSLKEESLAANLDYMKQAVNYAWLKSCSWAVLTNFRVILVLNADKPYGRDSYCFTLYAKDLDRTSEQLFYLTKKGFETGALDEWASENGKKPPKISVDRKLLEDLMRFREILLGDIKHNNIEMRLEDDDLEDAVQRTLDRLIFIRNAEDRKLESNELRSNYRQWATKERGHLINRVRELYRKYKDSYNSGLFGEPDRPPHISDQVQISNDSLRKVIQGLYSPEEEYYSYDFSVIEADVLGKMYEQYLGHIITNGKKKTVLHESRAHRRKQGIYYTPTYVVNHIVKNTVGQYINTHTPEEIKTVRILDPSCGSGSFLIAAYQELENYWNDYFKKGKKVPKSAKTINQARLNTAGEESGFYTIKERILKENIYGVDLDPKAVEIARLNLLLKISESGKKLPILKQNIKSGNSLLPLDEYGDSGFDWEEEFPQVMSTGGFDIVIGNPPYVSWNEISYLERAKFETGKYFDLEFACRPNHEDSQPNYYLFFLTLASNVISGTGIVSFILPQEWLYSNYALGFRNYFLNSFSTIRILQFNPDFKVFKSYNEIIGTNSLIVIFSRGKKERVHWSYIESADEGIVLDLVARSQIKNTITLASSSLLNNVWRFIEPELLEIKDKINNLDDILLLSDRHVFKVFGGFQPPTSDASKFEVGKGEYDMFSSEEKNITFPVVYDANQMQRYYINIGEPKYWIVANEIENDTVLKKRYPNVYKLLHRRILGQDGEIEENACEWWKFPNIRNFEAIKKTSKKLISPRTSNGPSFSLDPVKCVFKGTNTALVSNKLPAEYVLGILNSSLSRFWYSKFGYEYHGSSAKKFEPDKVKRYMVPIRDASSKLKSEMVNNVNEISRLFSELKKFGNKQTERRANLDEKIKRKDLEIDDLVYKIYELNGSDRALIEKYL